MQLTPATPIPHRRMHDLADLGQDVGLVRASRGGKGEGAGDRRHRHDSAEHLEQRRPAERGDQIGRYAEEYDGEHAEREANHGEQPVRIDAVGDGAMGEAEPAGRRGAGDRVQRRERRKVRHARSREERDRRQRKARRRRERLGSCG